MRLCRQPEIIAALKRFSGGFLFGGRMSADLKLGGSHDLDLCRLTLVDGAQRVRQQIEITLLTFLGEWFLDTEHGVPYFEQILKKAPNRAAAEAVIRAKVKDVPGVVSVSEMRLLLDSPARRFAVRAKVQTDEGLVEIGVNV